ncbi:MAG: serine/threonine-protein kinase [Wenzhouxiangella sp.]|jgi:serine/threonine-protein kinase|nr:serine/threonine-protein kinase [Wenzhouxiangella sp.]
MTDSTPDPKVDEHWRLVDRCFDEVLDAPVARREEVLASMQDRYSTAVVDEVRDLLGALGTAESIFARPAPAQFDVLDVDGPDDPVQIGRWRIARRLGSGGQGSVYLATKQAEQFEQVGALKILKGQLGSSAMALFLRERQTLARLRHPNIAALLDAGASDSGRPYLVSEFIEGLTFDRYLDANNLSPGECVRLLLPIVDAVAYAHQQFVLHRDIKPANVIVDQDGSPYLLDFGVSAALTDASEGPVDAVSLTPYTPSYAAPEQIRNAPVDVRTDCWSLGALLYRALAGRSPFAAEDVDDTIRAVLDETPEPPGDQPELNAIVARCLAKPIDDRYEDAGQLREDLKAWLDGMPVRAASNSRRYLVRKWFRRHRLLTASSALAAASLLTGALVAGHQAQRAAEQRDLAATAARQYEAAVALLADVFNGANPALRRGELPSADDLLAEAYSRVDGMDQQPGVRAALADELSAVFLNRGDAEKAARLSLYAIDYFERSDSDRSERYANALVTLASAEKLLGEYDQAIPRLERSLQVQRQHLWPSSDWRYAYTQNMLGSLYSLMGDHGRAVDLFGSAMASLEDSEDGPEWLTGMVLRNFWNGRFRLGHGAEAALALDAWLEAHAANSAEEPSAYVHAGLGEMALAAGRYREAQQSFSTAGRLIARVYGQAHRDALLFGERARYAGVLADGVVTVGEQAGLLEAQQRILAEASDQPMAILRSINQCLSLLPYLDRSSRAGWYEAQIGQLSLQSFADRLLWHQHLLLRALTAQRAGFEAAAAEALAAAGSTRLYDSPQSSWQRGLESRLGMLVRQGDRSSCQVLRDQLDGPIAVELAIAARGLRCAGVAE